MDARMRTDLVLMRGQRNRLANETRQIDLEIGRLADRAIADDHHTTKSSLGRLLGMSHTHVGNLIDAARSTPEPETGDRIPVMDNVLAADYVLAIGARIIRSVSGFHEGDVLVASGLDPRLFAGEDNRAEVPNMLWRLDTGEWIGVSKANVGYGGTGGSYSRQALVRAGVAEQTADEIVRWRFCDTHEDMDGPAESWTRQNRWPVYARSVPRVIDDRIVVLFGDGLRSLTTFPPTNPPVPLQPPVDESGFYPSVTNETPLQAWFSFLNQDQNQLPEWAQGPRLARVYRHDEAAAEDGFTTVPSGARWGSSQRRHPCVVIEQGLVQFWGFFIRPRDTTQYVPEEAYEALRLADVYPHDLVEHDDKARRPWARFIRAFVPRLDDLPDSIDISHNGSEALSYLPSEPMAHLG